MTTTTLVIKDANSANQTLGMTQGASNLYGCSVIGDGSNPDTARATVAQFHNADNQALGGSAYGLTTGGVAQLLNSQGNIDRQRETGADNVPALGIATGAAQFAMAWSTTTASNLGTGAQTYTTAANSGTIGGVTWSIQVGSVISIDTSTSQEYVVVTGVNNSTPSITATFAKAHNGSGTAVVISGFTYNQERDAAGEGDGASGAGTAVAAEYLFNAGAPSLGNYDRARSVQGLGRTTTSISSGGTTSSKSLTLAAVTGLKAGMQLTLYKTASYPGGNPETVYVAPNFVEGSTTVPITSGVVNGTQDTAAWGSFNVLGPSTSGFQMTGIAASEEVIYDPGTGLGYLERAATSDVMASVNLAAAGNATYNEASWDRQRGNTSLSLLASATRTTTQTIADQVNYNGRGCHVILAASTFGASSGIQLTINGKDPASGAYYNLLTGTTLAAAATNVYSVYPGITVASNAAVSQILPRTFQVVITATNTGTVAYSVGANIDV